MIRVGLPKGRMAAQSEKICSLLGVQMTPGVLRYRAHVGGCPVGMYLLKAPDIARLLKQDVLDLGVTGDEWLLEHGVCSRRWCSSTGAYIASVCLLMAERDSRALRRLRSVVTPYPNLARSLLAGLASDVRIVAVAGSSEGLVPDVGDACIDVVETGDTATLNGLVVRKRFRRVTTHLARSGRHEPAVVRPVLELVAAAVGGA